MASATNGGAAPQQNNRAKFFAARRRSTAHMRLKVQNNDGGGDLTDMELCVLAAMDAKGRLATAEAVDIFLQAMMHAQTLEDKSLLLAVLESSKKHKAALDAFVDLGGLRVLRNWLTELMSRKSDKACMSLIHDILAVSLLLPVTWKALSQSNAPLVMLKGLKEQAYLDDTKVKSLVKEMKRAWSTASTATEQQWEDEQKQLELKGLETERLKEAAIQATADAEAAEERRVTTAAIAARKASAEAAATAAATAAAAAAAHASSSRSSQDDALSFFGDSSPTRRLSSDSMDPKRLDASGKPLGGSRPKKMQKIMRIEHDEVMQKAGKGTPATAAGTATSASSTAEHAEQTLQPLPLHPAVTVGGPVREPSPDRMSSASSTAAAPADSEHEDSGMDVDAFDFDDVDLLSSDVLLDDPHAAGDADDALLRAIGDSATDSGRLDSGVSLTPSALSALSSSLPEGGAYSSGSGAGLFAAAAAQSPLLLDPSVTAETAVTAVGDGSAAVDSSSSSGGAQQSNNGGLRSILKRPTAAKQVKEGPSAKSAATPAVLSAAAAASKVTQTLLGHANSSGGGSSSGPPRMDSFRAVAAKSAKPKIKWADSAKKHLREVRQFKTEEMTKLVGTTATLEQLHHHEPRKWEQMVKSERAKEGEHLHKLDDIVLESDLMDTTDSDAPSRGTRSKARNNANKKAAAAAAGGSTDAGSEDQETPKKQCKPVVPFGRPAVYPTGFCVEPESPVVVDSDELKLQTTRCRGMMETLYLSASEIPDTPGEVDDLQAELAGIEGSVPPSIPYFSEEEIAEQQALEQRLQQEQLDRAQRHHESTMAAAAAASAAAAVAAAGGGSSGMQYGVPQYMQQQQQPQGPEYYAQQQQQYQQYPMQQQPQQQQYGVPGQLPPQLPQFVAPQPFPQQQQQPYYGGAVAAGGVPYGDVPQQPLQHQQLQPRQQYGPPNTQLDAGAPSYYGDAGGASSSGHNHSNNNGQYPPHHDGPPQKQGHKKSIKCMFWGVDLRRCRSGDSCQFEHDDNHVPVYPENAGRGGGGRGRGSSRRGGRGGRSTR